MTPSYTYRAAISRVIDGDTLVVNVDLGFSVWLHGLKIRLLGINCPELSTDEGKLAQLFVLKCVNAMSNAITLTSVKTDKYGGRWDATVFMGDGFCLNSELVKAGHAKVYGILTQSALANSELV